MVDAFAGAKDIDQLAEPLGSLMRYAMTLAGKQGKSFTLTSGKRSYEAQVQLRRQHCGSSQYDIYEKPASQCSPPTARPGTSKHQKGLAADMGGSKEWAYSVLSAFNIKRPVPGEDWHFEWRGNDAEAELGKLKATMIADGFSFAEIDYVLGKDKNVKATTAVNASWPSLPGWVPGVDDIPLPSPSDIPGVGALQDIARISAKLTDPALWRRLGWGMIGLLMVLAGLLLVARAQGTELIQDLVGEPE